MKRPTVPTRVIEGGRTVCACHGDPVRWIWRRDNPTYEGREPIHCEHPERYIEYGDGYIPDYCEACGWRA
jgi:hypothetical protein